MPAIDINESLKKIQEKAKENKEEMEQLIKLMKTNPKEAAKIMDGVKINRWVCSIHKNRPMICRLYPCGRFQQIDIKTKERKEMFMLQEDQKGFCPGFEQKYMTTLSEFLVSQNFYEYQVGSKLFTDIMDFLISNGFRVATKDNKNDSKKASYGPNSNIILFLGNLIYNFDSFNTFSKDPKVVKTIYSEKSTQDDFLYVENKIYYVVKQFVETMKKQPLELDFKVFLNTLLNKI